MSLSWGLHIHPGLILNTSSLAQTRRGATACLPTLFYDSSLLHNRRWSSRRRRLRRILNDIASSPGTDLRPRSRRNFNFWRNLKLKSGLIIWFIRYTRFRIWDRISSFRFYLAAANYNFFALIFDKTKIEEGFRTRQSARCDINLHLYLSHVLWYRGMISWHNIFHFQYTVFITRRLFRSPLLS